MWQSDPPDREANSRSSMLWHQNPPARPVLRYIPEIKALRPNAKLTFFAPLIISQRQLDGMAQFGFRQGLRRIEMQSAIALKPEIECLDPVIMIPHFAEQSRLAGHI